MRMGRKLVLLCLIVSIGALCCCAPTKKFIKTSDSFEDSISEMTEVAVINDLALKRNPMGEDTYTSVEMSLNSASYMLEGVKQLLDEKGYEVSYVLTPFVGSTMRVDTVAIREIEEELAEAEKVDTEKMTAYERQKHEQKIKKTKKKIKSMGSTEFIVKQTEDSEPIVHQEGPFYTSRLVEDDLEYKEALIGLFRNIQDENLAVEYFPSLKEHVNTRYALLILSWGESVSGGKQIGQQFLTGCFTTAATMGMVTVYASESSYLSSRVKLIDLKNKEIIWENSGGLVDGDPTSKKFYKADKWSRQLLYHIPKRN